MKKFTFIIAIMCLILIKPATAQDIKFGAKAGYLEGTLAVEDGEWQSVSPGYEIGLFGQYNIMDILGVSFEPVFSRQGSFDFDPINIYHEDSPKLDFEYKDQKLFISKIEFPVLAQLNMDMGMDVRLFAGPSFDYISKVTHYTWRDQASIDDDFIYEISNKSEVTERFQYWNYAAVIGVGTDFEVGPVDLRVDVKYKHGFNDINVVQYKPSIYTRYLGVTVGVGINRLFF